MSSTIRILRRSCIAAIAALSFGIVLSDARVATASDPPPVSWYRDTTDPHWVVGYAIVETPPDAVWSALQQVPRWPSMFTDIQTMRVKRHDGSTWKLEMSTQTFNCGTHDYDVTFAADRTATVRINAPGVDAVARVTVRPGPTATESIVGYSLYADTHGVVGWLISDRALREKQEAMVQRYLGDFERVFSPPTPRS
jgi:hypothetical protein